MWSITTLVAPICGPLLGGYISRQLSLGLDLPDQCAGRPGRRLPVLATILSDRETPTRKLPIDTVGLGLLVVWAGALQLMLDQRQGPGLVRLHLDRGAGDRHRHRLWRLPDVGADRRTPIVDLSLFKSRNFALGTLVFCLGNAVFLASNLLMPLWLQTQLGYTATWAGLVSAPTGVIAVLLTPLAAKLMNKLDARLVATVAFIAFGVSYLMRARLTADASFVGHRCR